MTLMLLSILAAIIMIIAAIGAVLHKDLTTAVLFTGAMGLAASLFYLIMASPDVAMTEAAIGSGLTTAIFFYSLSRIRSRKDG